SEVSQRLHQLNQVAPGPKLDAGNPGQLLDHQLGILRLGIEAGAHGRSPYVELTQPIRRRLQLVPMALNRAAVRSELLAQSDRRGVLQVGTPRLDDVSDLLALGKKRGCQPVE